MSSGRDLPPLNALRAFEATARLGSVTAAAAALHVTHGAISRQLRHLETELGCDLFRRQGRQLVLTDAGRQLAGVAGEAFAQLAAATARLRQDPVATARVLGCPGSVLARWMIPRMERLAADLPDLALHLSARETMTLSPWPAGIDAVLMIAQAHTASGLCAYPLAPEWIGPVLSPAYAAARDLEHAPAHALTHEPLLHTASRPQAWPAWAQAFALPAASLHLTQGFEHLYYLLEAAVAGLGVAIAPYPLVADDLSAGRLLAPWGFVQTSAQWMLYTPHRRDTRIQALATWLSQQLIPRPAETQDEA